MNILNKWLIQLIQKDQLNKTNTSATKAGFDLDLSVSKFLIHHNLFLTLLLGSIA